MSKKNENNNDKKSTYDKENNPNFNCFSISNINSKKQKSVIEKSSFSNILNFNYFNEKNNIFSNSSQELFSKKKNLFLNSNNFSSLLTRENEERQNSIIENNENEENKGDMFDILLKHLIYEENETDLLINNSIENKNYHNNEENNIFDNETNLEQEDIIIINNFLNLAKDKSSCKFLQQKIHSQPYLIKYFFPLLINNIDELIIHPYGNYLIKNILNYLSKDEISQFVNVIKKKNYKYINEFLWNKSHSKLNRIY